MSKYNLHIIHVRNPVNNPPSIFTYQPLARLEAGAGVAPSPSDERREILQPSLLPVPDNSGPGVPTTSDHNRVSNGVRDGTGDAVNNNVTNIIKTSLHLTLTLRHI